MLLGRWLIALVQNVLEESQVRVLFFLPHLCCFFFFSRSIVTGPSSISLRLQDSFYEIDAGLGTKGPLAMSCAATQKLILKGSCWPLTPIPSQKELFLECKEIYHCRKNTTNCGVLAIPCSSNGWGEKKV